MSIIIFNNKVWVQGNVLDLARRILAEHRKIHLSEE